MTRPTNSRTGGRRFLWLGLGAALLLAANGRWMVPLATWFFAVGWLVFLERSRRASGLVTAFVVYAMAHFVIWRGIIPAPGFLYYVIAATYAAVYFLPFVAHRLLARRVGSYRATLVFPLAWVSVEFVFSRWLTPYGSWASLAYSQTEWLELLQIVSVTGLAGITFLLTWFGSVAAWALRPADANDSRLQGLLTFGTVLLAVIAFGHLRLLEKPSGDSVRAAGLVPSAAAMAELERSMRPLRQGRALTASQHTELEASAARLNGDLLARSRREALAGARLIAWSETAARVYGRDEEALVQRARSLAAEHEVVLLLALGVLHPGGSPPFENKVVVIDSDGDVAWEFHKAHPIVGAESSFVDAGRAEIESLDTGFGRLGAVICHDLDFPPLLLRASARQIDILVAPSDDWELIAVLHARMALVRSVENGFTLFRPTNGGRSLAADSRGRVIARHDLSTDSFVAHLPSGREPTIYGRAGDLFSWLCLLGLIAVSLMPGQR